MLMGNRCSHRNEGVASDASTSFHTAPCTPTGAGISYPRHVPGSVTGTRLARSHVVCAKERTARRAWDGPELLDLQRTAKRRWCTVHDGRL